METTIERAMSSDMREIFSDVLSLLDDRMRATPTVDMAWRVYRATVTAAEDALAAIEQRELGEALDSAVAAFTTELMVEAFLAGLAFDGRALLMETPTPTARAAAAVAAFGALRPAGGGSHV